MKKMLPSLFLSGLLMVLNSFPLIAQTDSARQSIFSIVEKEAEYPGGHQAWKTFLEDNLRSDIPVKKGAKPGVYSVFVQFVVNPDGSIGKVIPLTSYGFGMEKEVVRIINKSKKWDPAVQNGRHVKAYRKQGITFNVYEANKRGSFQDDPVKRNNSRTRTGF